MEKGVRALEEILSSRGVDAELKIYEGEPHGWNLVEKHLDEALHPHADTRPQRPRPIAFDSENGQIDMPAQQDVADLTKAEALRIVYQPAEATPLSFPADVCDAAENVVRIGVHAILLHQVTSVERHGKLPLKLVVDDPAAAVLYQFR